MRIDNGNENDDDTAVNLTQLSNESSPPKNYNHESVDLSFTNDINEQEVDNQSNVSEKTNQFQIEQSLKSNEEASIEDNQDFDEPLSEEETSEVKEKNAQAIASIGILVGNIINKYESKNGNEKRKFLEKSIDWLKAIVEDYCLKEEIDLTNEDNKIKIGKMKINFNTFD